MVAATRGWRVLGATVRLQRLTELAYLRDGQVKESRRGRHPSGPIPVEEAKALRGVAIDDPRGLKLSLPRFRRPRPVAYQPPTYPGPSGIGGNWPAQAGGTPLGSPGYSAVDPKWGPPTG